MIRPFSMAAAAARTIRGELDPRPGIREQPGSISSFQRRVDVRMGLAIVFNGFARTVETLPPVEPSA